MKCVPSYRGVKNIESSESKQVTYKNSIAVKYKTIVHPVRFSMKETAVV
jgi:hypothetical protein